MLQTASDNYIRSEPNRQSRLNTTVKPEVLNAALGDICTQSVAAFKVGRFVRWWGWG